MFLYWGQNWADTEGGLFAVERPGSDLDNAGPKSPIRVRAEDFLLYFLARRF
jgi:hypothetical protein